MREVIVSANCGRCLSIMKYLLICGPVAHIVRSVTPHEKTVASTFGII